MRGWVLHTAISPGRFADEIFPVTDPLFRAYAERHGMDYLVHEVTDTELAEFRNTSPAPRGTETLYANIPFWRELLDRYEGVVFMDADAVIVDPSADICEAVDLEHPFSCVECTAEATKPGVVGLNTGVVVTLACEATRELLDEVWQQRETFKRTQWLEQAAIMHLFGYDPVYPDCTFIGETEYTPLLAKLDWRWNSMPTHAVSDPYVKHPAGVQPFEARLALVHSYAAEVLV